MNQTFVGCADDHVGSSRPSKHTSTKPPPFVVDQLESSLARFVEHGVCGERARSSAPPTGIRRIGNQADGIALAQE